jgi:NAD(P)H-hydrate epimerase
LNLIDATDEPLALLAPRRADSHKGNYGRVLVIGGSRGMAGAAGLAGLAALRSGAGLVAVATPGSVQNVVASYSPCYTTVPLVEDEEGIVDFANVVDLAGAGERFDAWAIGPGLGQSAGAAELVAQLYRSVPRPMVVDADGLNGMVAALERNPQALNHPAGPRVLTPHPGEFARLTGQPPSGDTAERSKQAAALCQLDDSGQTVVILKGHESVVSDGQRFALNRTGNPGLATGGTGDCLTGVVAGLLGQGMPAWDAARLAAHVHGLAGDLAAAALGEVSLIASDLIDYLPAALKSLR